VEDNDGVVGDRIKDHITAVTTTTYLLMLPPFDERITERQITYRQTFRMEPPDEANRPSAIVARDIVADRTQIARSPGGQTNPHLPIGDIAL